MSRLPIRLRVTLAFAAAMAVLLAGLGVFVYTQVEGNLESNTDTGLRSRADDVAALVSGSRGGALQGSRTALAAEESFAQILTTDGRVFDTTAQIGDRPLLSGAELQRAAQGPVFLYRDSVPGLEGHARLLVRPAESGGRELLVIVGSSVDDNEEALSNLLRILLIGGPVALLLASLAGYLVSGVALRPVEAMRSRAAAISADEPDERLPVPDTDDEIARLGETLNAMLGRLETALERERTFVDDASHELRTPLALHKTELELALRYSKNPEELRAAISSAVDEVDRLIQLAEGLLVVARSDQGKLALELRQVRLTDVLGDLQERFASRALEAGRSLEVQPSDGLELDADRLRLEQALTNLIDNALRYGRGDIRVRAVESNGAVELHVEDAGPGFPPEFIGRAFERFSRADSARAKGGTGLGLAIVEAIARAHRGRARAANRPRGGADVWIELPAERK